MTVPGLILPSRSPASIIAAPILSFTLLSGWKNSHFANTVHCSGEMTRLRRTMGVSPMAWAMLSNVRLRGMALSLRESGVCGLPARLWNSLADNVYVLPQDDPDCARFYKPIAEPAPL